MSGIIHTGPPVYIDAARAKVVPESSPEAAFLMVGTGGTVDREYVALYREHFGIPADDDAVAEKPRTVTIGKPHGEHTAKPAAEPAVEPAAEPAAEPAEGIEVQPGETAELVDGDADPGAPSEPIVNLDELDRDQLLEYAEKHGLEVNRRLGEANLRKAISEAPLPPVVGGNGEQES